MSACKLTWLPIIQQDACGLWDWSAKNGGVDNSFVWSFIRQFSCGSARSGLRRGGSKHPTPERFVAVGVVCGGCFAGFCLHELLIRRILTWTKILATLLDGSVGIYMKVDDLLPVN